MQTFLCEETFHEDRILPEMAGRSHWVVAHNKRFLVGGACGSDVDQWHHGCSSTDVKRDANVSLCPPSCPCHDGSRDSGEEHVHATADRQPRSLQGTSPRARCPR